ncbi:AER072Wp [Eremothecium gossypii ATCC 10895]|uniref:AER072Wp n=1 Tax=Eremothecium gossypii (strain ATCC 10895 / CBS 109.51 / FGSC 9923 / NRRL Y-1056) TaxID=284811 RepID=Q757E1_EREGS|nr:AER072Wp [Eremothecium gossypii ATCC 10895]AAS52756.2 AER072Wp [Eremothecium gossypii ATCC 10895]AEY97062.1 FAER072Wp [Eremothecium gossypii FDAG1]
MQINVLWPLQWVPWATYAAVILWVQVVVILPLATVLWQDFYSQLLPSESHFERQLRPVKAPASAAGSVNYMWSMELWRQTVSPQDVTSTPPSAGHEQLAVQSGIPYLLVIDLQLYCFDQEPIHVVTVEVAAHTEYFTVTCFPSVEHAMRSPWTAQPLATRIQHEFENRLQLPDILLSADTRMVNVTIQSTARLRFGHRSAYSLSMQVGGIRYAMLHWYRTCHILGTTLFVGVISAWFYISFSIAFMVIGFLRGAGAKNTKS